MAADLNTEKAFIVVKYPNGAEMWAEIDMETATEVIVHHCNVPEYKPVPIYKPPIQPYGETREQMLKPVPLPIHHSAFEFTAKRVDEQLRMKESERQWGWNPTWLSEWIQKDFNTLSSEVKELFADEPIIVENKHEE